MKSKKYLYLLAVVIFVLGMAASVYVFFTVKLSEESSLLKRANTIAQLISADSIKNLSGSELDLQNSDYLSLKSNLQKVLKVNPDIRFIYLMGKRENNIFFFVDSEPPDSPDYSPPGQDYPEASPKCHAVFNSDKGIIEGISTDRWGTWISALTPIINPEQGNALAVLGMDIGAWGQIQRMVIYSLPVFLVTVFLLILLFVYISMRKKEIKRMDQKSELVSMAAHEIRSPLTGISWGLEMFLSKIPDNTPKDVLELISNIKTSNDNVQKTVNNFLDLYTQDEQRFSMDIERFDTLIILKELLDNFQLAGKQKEIIFSLESDIQTAFISGNRDRLKRMFGNLLSNAIKYSKQGGSVRLAVRDSVDSYLFSVADDGIGVLEKDKKKIFKGFYRTKGARLATDQGTGLGLYYIKQVVDLHKGQIWLESEENKGSTFFIKLKK